MIFNKWIIQVHDSSTFTSTKFHCVAALNKSEAALCTYSLHKGVYAEAPALIWWLAN